MPGWRFFGFVDPVAEHNYVQQYCASRFWGRVAATVVLMLAQLGPVVFSKLAAPAGIAAQSCHVGNFWTAVVGVPSMLLLAAAVGSSYFVNSWGHVYISCQVLVATGLGFAVRPPCCAWCAFVWQRRVLVASAVGIISPVLTHHYILGGIISWLAASLVDYADPQAACGQSWVCVAGAVQQLIAACARGGPTTLTYYVLQALASHASRGHLADWLVPGLLVCYREGRSRTAWLAQQQQQQPLEQQPSSSQAAESSSFMTAVTAGAAGARHVHWAEGSLTTSEAQAEALTRPGLGAPAGAAAAAAAALLPAAAPPLAAAHGSVSPRVQQLILARMAAGLPLYVSPARSKLVSIKLNSPEGAGTADRALVMQALRDAFNAFYSQQAAQGGPPGGRPFTGPAAPGIITECASFPGCWQLTLRVLSGINQATAADETARAQQHHFQGFKHQVAKRANGSWVVEAT